MKRSQEYELRKWCGDPSALCGVRDFVFNDGPARGIRAFDLKNGRGIEMTVLADRGKLSGRRGFPPFLKKKKPSFGRLPAGISPTSMRKKSWPSLRRKDR